MSASPIAAASASAPANSRIRKLRRCSSRAAAIAFGCFCLGDMVVVGRSVLLWSHRRGWEHRQARLDRSPAVDLVHDVDTVVLAVRTRNAEEERQPAPEAEPSLVLERAGKDE